MSAAVATLTLVTLQRLVELLWARRNTAWLLRRGAEEVGARHYPAIVALHAAWLAGLWMLGHDAAIRLGWLALFAVLQVARLWVLITLGRRWTTRIMILPGAPRVRSGPYRLTPHPNYLIVAGEILVLPLAFGLVAFAVIFSLLNAVVLYVRIRVESAALPQ